MTCEENLVANAECSVVGGMLLYPDECHRALETLCKDDFYNPAFKAIFSVLKDMDREGKPIDVPLVISRIDRIDKSLREAAVFCADSFISCAGYEEYIRVVKADSRRRRILERLQNILFFDNTDPLAEITKIAEEEEKRASGIIAQNQLTIQICDFLEEISKPVLNNRIYTGMSRLDNALGGLRLKTLSYVGARPSTGKTAFALNILKKQIFTKNKTVFFSLEMSVPQIMERLFADMGNLSYGMISDRKITQEQNSRISQIAAQIAEQHNTWIVDELNTIEGIAETIQAIKPQLVIVDFMQCVRTTQRFHDRREEVDYISQEFKRLAKRYNCHIMVLSQITRAGKEEPRMSDLKESGGLEQDGDYIILLHRPYVLDKYDRSLRPETAYAVLDKNKYGRTGKVSMNFSGEYQRFTEIETREMESG